LQPRCWNRSGDKRNEQEKPTVLEHGCSPFGEAVGQALPDTFALLLRFVGQALPDVIVSFSGESLTG
jgi:hypothetical protein